MEINYLKAASAINMIRGVGNFENNEKAGNLPGISFYAQKLKLENFKNYFLLVQPKKIISCYELVTFTVAWNFVFFYNE